MKPQAPQSSYGKPPSSLSENSFSMSEGIQTASEEEKPTLWKCREPYRFPIPKPDGDPWEILLEPLLNKDKIQCDAWKDEVQNLLIFAGLFSAVVTTFVVESYKTLQRDPSDATVLLLSGILARLDNNAMSTPAAPLVELPPFVPAAVSIRVNIFWFISLILSLTTVLIGIISLQWIREHQSYPGRSPKEIFAIFNMRAEALERWYVPRIFAALPIILQAALVCFVTGLCDFLRALHVSVAAPIIILVGFTLTFMVATTVLPTLQGFGQSPSRIYGDRGLSVPCPYKSPQSEIFRHITTSSKTVFRTGFRTFKRLNRFIDEISTLTRRILRLKDYEPPILVLRPKTPFPFEVWRQPTWIKFDLMWLSLRDAYAQSIAENHTDKTSIVLPYHLERWHQRSPSPLYDSTQGLKAIFQETGENPSDSYLFAQYGCYQNLSESVVGRQSQTVHFTQDILQRNRYFHWLLEKSTGYKSSKGFISDRLNEQPGMEFLGDENMFTVINIIDPSHTSQVLSKNFGELHFRLMGHLYAQPWRLDTSESNLESSLMFDPEVLYNLDIYNGKQQTFTHQWALTLEAFFQAINIHAQEAMEQSFHIHPVFQRFMQYFWTAVVNDRWIDMSHPATIDEATSTMSSIGITLIARSSDNGPPPDLLFYFASVYMKWFRMRNPYYRKLRTAADNLLPLMRNYQDHMGGGNFALESKLGAGRSDSSGELLFSEHWWNFLGGSAQNRYSRPQYARSQKKVRRQVHWSDANLSQTFTYKTPSEISRESITALHNFDISTPFTVRAAQADK